LAVAITQFLGSRNKEMKLTKDMYIFFHSTEICTCIYHKAYLQTYHLTEGAICKFHEDVLFLICREWVLEMMLLLRERGEREGERAVNYEMYDVLLHKYSVSHEWWDTTVLIFIKRQTDRRKKKGETV